MKRMYFLIVLLISLLIIGNIFIFNSGGQGESTYPLATVSAPLNGTGKPTETITYTFLINNTSDGTDSYQIQATSAHGWEAEVLGSDMTGVMDANESIIVDVNVTIPAGVDAEIKDKLTVEAISQGHPQYQGTPFENYTWTIVEQGFVVELSVDGSDSKTSFIHPEHPNDYSIRLTNRGNQDISVTLKFQKGAASWDVGFLGVNDQLHNELSVLVGRASGPSSSDYGVREVTIRVSAPSDYLLSPQMAVKIWATKDDWRSNDITIVSMITAEEGVFFTSDSLTKEIGEVDGIVLTRYYLNLESIGLETTDVHLEVESDGYFIWTLTTTDFTLPKQGSKRVTLNVSTSKGTPQGNYTITIIANESLSANELGRIDLYYIVIPWLNITEIGISEEKPTQHDEVELTATISNIGLVDARDINVTFYDEEEEIDTVPLPWLNVSETKDVTIEWIPANYGNRTIRAVIDIEGLGGSGDFSAFASDIESEEAHFKIKIDWEPYYLAFYIILLIILGVGVVGGISEMRYGVVPSAVEEGESYDTTESIPDYADVDTSVKGPPMISEKPPTPIPRKEPRFPREAMPSAVKPKIMPSPVISRERAKPRVRKKPLTEEDELKEEIASSQMEIDKAKSLGVDVTMIEQLLNKANKTYEEQNFDKTRDYLRYVDERLQNLLEKRNEAIKTIRDAREAIAKVKSTKDVTIAENFIVKANSLLEQGNYREAINYANKAKDRVTRQQSEVLSRDEPRL